MNTLKPISTLIFICFISSFGLTQQFGDTLYVIAYNGLNIRALPSISSEKIAGVPFGTPLIYCSDSYNAQFEVRNGKWIEVEHNGISSYVFDGFLTTHKPPSSRKMTLQQLDKYIKEAYGINLTNEINEKSIVNGDPEDKSISTYSTGLKVTHKFQPVIESWEYAFPSLRTRDLINLVDLAFSNYNQEGKTLISHFEENDFWKNKDPQNICAGAFHVKISDNIRIQYEYYSKRSGVDPVPKIYIMKHSQ